MKPGCLPLLLAAAAFYCQSCRQPVKDAPMVVKEAPPALDSNQQTRAFLRQWMEILEPKDSVLFCTQPLRTGAEHPLRDTLSEDFFAGFRSGPGDNKYGDMRNIDNVIRSASPQDTMFSAADIKHLLAQDRRTDSTAWNPADFNNKQFITPEQVSNIFGKAGPAGWSWLVFIHILALIWYLPMPIM